MKRSEGYSTALGENSYKYPSLDQIHERIKIKAPPLEKQQSEACPILNKLGMGQSIPTLTDEEIELVIEELVLAKISRRRSSNKILR